MITASVMKELNGAVNNHNVRMYASTKQAPDFHYNVDDGPQKLIL